MPRLALPRVLSPSFPALRSLLARAKPGEPMHVMLSAYCLKGTTRNGTSVRPGVIAADPRVFPLSRHVELYAAGRYLGRFRVEDTGSKIKGTRIDIWTPDCKDAIRFGMRSGVATMVSLGAE
jgi:3D (Asp-Asp-Asp) domain-containing protein